MQNIPTSKMKGKAMYIEPNSSIRLFKNLPLYRDNYNTIYFDTQNAQLSYFISKASNTLSGNSFVRTNTNRIKVALPYKSVYDVNYLSFNNYNFENKWFYCFVTEVNYINNETSELVFQIDPMQTWLFDIKLLESFVVREHSTTDNIGDNITAESVELGEYLVQALVDDKVNRDTGYFVVQSTFDIVNDALVTAQGDYYLGYPCALKNFTFDTITELNNWIGDITELGASGGIVSVGMCPDSVPVESTEPYVEYIREVSAPSNLNGYTPKNKKLLTYPFCFLEIDNGEGATSEMHFEYFDKRKPDFILRATYNGSLLEILTPEHYKGVGENYQYSLPKTYASQVGYITDTYKAWLAVNAVPQQVGLVTNTVSAIGQVATGNIVGGISSFTNSLISTSMDLYKAEKQPPTVSLGGNPSAMYVAQRNTYKFYTKTIRADFAKRIDEYFSMYGYSTNRVKVPYISSRPHWNFVQTRSCNIRGNAPTGQIDAIKKLFDRGITFWKNGDDIGNYELDNSPV